MMVSENNPDGSAQVWRRRRTSRLQQGCSTIRTRFVHALAGLPLGCITAAPFNCYPTVTPMSNVR
jgi:hypothetical protein